MSRKSGCPVITGRNVDSKASDVLKSASRNRAFILVIGILIGFLGYATVGAVVQGTKSLSVYGFTAPDQLEKGMWFRWDFNAPLGFPFYIIGNVTNVTTAGAIDGDPIVAAAAGNDTKWYAWDLRAYWADGTEATSLYGKNNTKNPMWDEWIRLLFEGYAGRKNYNLADAQGFTKADIVREIFRPMMHPKVPTTFSREVINLPAGKKAVGFQGTKIYPLDYNGTQTVYNYCQVLYDPDNGLFLISMCPLGLKNHVSYIWLSSWGRSQVRPPVVVSPTEKVEGWLSPSTGSGTSWDYSFILKYGKDVTSISISLKSSNEAICPSFNSTITPSSDGISNIPVYVNGSGTADVTIKYIVSHTASRTSTGILSGYTVEDIIKPIVNNTGAKEANATVNAYNDTITIDWTPSQNATSYLVYANGSFLFEAGSNETSFDWHPPFYDGNQSYIFSVVTTVPKFQNVTIGNNTVFVNDTVTNTTTAKPVFVMQTDLTPPPTPPMYDDGVVATPVDQNIIVFIIVLALAASALIIAWRTPAIRKKLPSVGKKQSRPSSI